MEPSGYAAVDLHERYARTDFTFWTTFVFSLNDDSCKGTTVFLSMFMYDGSQIHSGTC